MATSRSAEMMRGVQDLRYETTGKRVRALARGLALADSRRAVLVWEPKRVVPSYAVPEEDVAATLVAADPVRADLHPVRVGAEGPPVLDPRTAFAAHTCPGEPLTLKAGGLVLEGAGFRPADPDLDGYVVLDFAAFDEWLEEEDAIVGHPRDPYSRIDVRRSSSRVQIEVDDVPLADTTSALLLFETHIGPRFYLPRNDVRMELLTPTATRTTCAYKGHASYFSVRAAGEHPDLAWTYEQPLPEMREIAGYLAFFDEHVDVTLDGVRRPRPVTPWS